MQPPNSTVDLWCLYPDDQIFATNQVDISNANIAGDSLNLERRTREKSALRRILAQNLSLNPNDISFKIAPGGKPLVDGCEFSVSHSGPWLVIATGSMPLGVDIETRLPRLDPLELAERFFHAADTQLLHDLDPAQRRQAFLRQWVAKEAALKVTGAGLGGNLHLARCVFDNLHLRAVTLNEERFAISEFFLNDGTRGAVAWQGAEPAEIIRRQPAEAGLS